MQCFYKEFQEAEKILRAANKIVIISHKHPDGDAVGANLALKLALKNDWQKQVISACIDPLPENSMFLAGASEYVADFKPEDFDVYVSVDCGASYMTKFNERYPQMFDKTKSFINIDHHASNDFFGTVNIVDPNATSTTQLIYNFLKCSALKIDRYIATALLHGLYFDSGSFMHSNTTPEVLRIASDLILKGADFKTIVKKQFKTTRVQQLKVWGKIFDRIKVTPKKVTRSFITQADIEEIGASSDDTAGAIDYLNSIPDGNLSTLIAEDKNGLLKGSMRTRVDHIDLAKITALFGGGGHKKAAGFSLPGGITDKDGNLSFN